MALKKCSKNYIELNPSLNIENLNKNRERNMPVLGSIQKWRHASRGGQYFCDTKYKDLSKITILVW